MASLAAHSNNPAQEGEAIQTDLAYLSRPHAAFSGGVTWALTARGLSIDGQPPVGSGGQPVTIERIWQSYGSLVDEAAAAFGVPLELILAFIATGSSGDPATIRYEPGYVSDEATPDRVSIGLMQTLLSTTRGALGDPSLGRDFLLQPQGSIRAGTAHVAQQARETKYDPPVVIRAYNAGSITGDYVHRYIGFFNDCFVVLRDATPRAPSFVVLMRNAAGQGDRPADRRSIRALARLLPAGAFALSVSLASADAAAALSQEGASDAKTPAEVAKRLQSIRATVSDAAEQHAKDEKSSVAADPETRLAWWHGGWGWHRGWGWHGGWGWHRGWGWHGGWGWHRGWGWHGGWRGPWGNGGWHNGGWGNGGWGNGGWHNGGWHNRWGNW